MSATTQYLAQQARAETLKMVTAANASHIGGALSMIDLLAVLYDEILQVQPNQPMWPGRDRFILSKGHGCSAIYAILALRGYFPLTELASFAKDGSRLMSHVSHKVPGVEFSTGSLGHGLPFGCGKALAAKRRKENWRTFVLVSDGELDEGSNWEAILFAPQHCLDNLVLIVDYNKIQSLGSVEEVIDLHPLAEKFRAFRWNVIEIDGHDHGEISRALSATPQKSGWPTCVIAHTTKGKGVDFMEHSLRWHYSSPKPEELEAALRQINRVI